MQLPFCTLHSSLVRMGSVIDRVGEVLDRYSGVLIDGYGKVPIGNALGVPT